MYSDTKVEEEKYRQYDIVILRHTHYRMYRILRETDLLNPGSLEQPRDYKGSSYAVLDTKTSEYMFKRIQLDKHILIRKLKETGENERLFYYLRGEMGKEA